MIAVPLPEGDISSRLECKALVGAASLGVRVLGGEVRRLGPGSSRRWAVVTEEGSSHEADRVVLCQASGD